MSPAHRHTLADLLRRSAHRSPDKIAIVCGATRWTYREFHEICERLAGGLQARGIGRGDRVAILSRNSHAFAALRFALARLGAVLVPINFMLKAEEVAFVLRHSGARLLAVGSGLYETGQLAATLAPGVLELISLPGESESPLLAGPPNAGSPNAGLPNAGPPPAAPAMVSFADLLAAGHAPSAVDLADTDLAQIVYTSGTESQPKGAMLTHGAVIAEYVSCMVDGEMRSDDIVLHSLPLYHCAQLDCFLGPGLYQGATNVITAAPTPDNLLALIAAHRITSFFAPPTVWIALLRSPLFDHAHLSSLTKGYYGASIMPVEVLREMQRRLPQVRLWNFYGQTEIAPLATVLRPEDQLRKPGSAGKPALNVETRLVDDEMQDVAPGEVGEIVHRSPQLLSGYYQDEERTRAAFTGGWFHSGDLGVLDEEGYLTVVDRKKDMIKTGGENVASREVEEAIYRLSQVSEVAVIGLPHPQWVEAVAAIIVLKAGADLAAAEVIAHCRVSLGAFKVPKAVLFVATLPKNPSGKLLKRELREAHGGHFPRE